MSQNNLINVVALQQFINQVKAADVGRQKEIRLDIATAKALSTTIALAMTRLAGDYEGLLQQQTQNTTTEVVEVKMDGGSWDPS